MRAYELLSKEELQSIISESTSFSEVLTKIGLVPSGSNHVQFKKYVEDNNFDISTMVGRAILRNNKIGVEKTPMEVFTQNSNMSSTKLKRKLFKYGLKEKKCELCGITEWNGRDLSFELHHINGNRHDNRYENIIILCPNCHSQTDNFRGKNSNSKLEQSRLDDLITIALNDKNNKINDLIVISDQLLINRDKRANPEKYIQPKIEKPKKEIKYCEVCGKPLGKGRIKFCSMECATNFQTKHIPSKEELLEASKNVHSLSELNRYLNLNTSDNAVKKWCNKYEIYEEVRNNFKQRTYPILQYNLDGTFIKEWYDGNTIEKELGIAKHLIQKCCTGRKKTTHGYIWKYKK